MNHITHTHTHTHKKKKAALDLKKDLIEANDNGWSIRYTNIPPLFCPIVDLFC